MEFQPNWEKVKGRMLAFWEGELIDRVMLYIEAPRAGVKKREVPAPATPEERAMNIDYQLESQMAHLEATYYGADSLPSLGVGLGPATFSMLLGAKANFREETVWSEPVIDRWGDLTEQIRINWEGDFWKMLEEMSIKAAELSLGKCAVKVPALQHGLDGLADLRGAERLAVDIIDRPQVIQKALMRLNSYWAAVYETLWRTAKSDGAELTDMLPLWCPGRFGALQCDFMVMINKKMFRQFMVPDLEKCTAFLDKSIFHLDGAEATHHLDELLAIEDLDCIQFQQGNTWGVTGDPIVPFIPMLKRIQEAGKGVYISFGNEELEEVMRELSSRRLFIGLGAKSEKEAKEIEKLAAKWTHD